MEFERDFIIQVHQRHKTPIMRTSSLLSVESQVKILVENLESNEEVVGGEMLLGPILNSSPSQDSDDASSVCYYFFCFILLPHF